MNLIVLIYFGLVVVLVASVLLMNKKQKDKNHVCNETQHDNYRDCCRLHRIERAIFNFRAHLDRRLDVLTSLLPQPIDQSVIDQINKISKSQTEETNKINNALEEQKEK